MFIVNSVARNVWCAVVIVVVIAFEFVVAHVFVRCMVRKGQRGCPCLCGAWCAKGRGTGIQAMWWE